MKPSLKLGLVLAFTLSLGVRARSQDVVPGQLQAALSSHASAFTMIPVASETPALANYAKVTRFATRFDGDHSLDAATVTEQFFSRYTVYAVRLQFASGAEQSIVVTAPPGGLQPEMHDMSGDNVPNDLVLTSKLFRSPLIVLLNDGHDHLTVAVAPGALVPGEGQASGPGQVRRASALASFGFKAGSLANGKEPFLPQLLEDLLSPVRRTIPMQVNSTSSLGRAPPLPMTQTSAT